MNKAEIIVCKKCAINIGTLTEVGDVEDIPSNPGSDVAKQGIRPSDAWLTGGRKLSTSITALCTTCVAADHIIELYLESHPTGHTQATLLKLIVIAQLLVTRDSGVRRNILDVMTLDSGSVVFDYSVHTHRKKVGNVPTSK